MEFQEVIFTARKQFAKIMFSQVSVSPQDGGGLPLVPGGGVCHPPGQTPFPGQAPPGQTYSPADTPCPVHAGIHIPPAQCMLGYTPQCMLGYTSPLPSACWDTHTPLPSACWDTQPPCPVHAGIHWNAFLFYRDSIVFTTLYYFTSNDLYTPIATSSPTQVLELHPFYCE